MGRGDSRCERPDEVHDEAGCRSPPVQRTCASPWIRRFVPSWPTQTTARRAEKHKLGNLRRSLDYQGQRPLSSNVEAVPQSCDCPGSERRGAEAARGDCLRRLWEALASPSQAVAVLGVPGLSAAGITSGLAALAWVWNGVRNRSRGCYRGWFLLRIRWLLQETGGA